MADDKDRLAAVRKAFGTYYQIKLGEENSYVMINGAQIVKFAAKQEADRWELTFHLVDGSSHVATSPKWSENFIREVFGQGVLDGTFEVDD
jgi:hypothetical protein